MGADWELFKLQLAALGGLLFLSLSITWIILYYVRLLDHPNERSSHTLATPKCGGVGIVSSFVVGVFASQLWGGVYLVEAHQLWSLVAPVMLIAGVSLVDDIKELSPALRLGVHVFAAVLFMCLAKVLPAKSDGGSLPVFMQCVWGGAGLLWLVGMSNAFNFMDGIDGLAAGQGLIVSFFFAVSNIAKGEYFTGFILLVLVVACLGFLAFNFPPAKVFMGDVGSVTIGFILASFAVLAFQKDPEISTFAIMPLLMFNFIFDTLTTFVHRLLRGECVFKAHQSHLYQKLVKSGLSQRTITMINYGMAIVQGVSVLLAQDKPMLVLLICLGIQFLYCKFVNMRFKRWDE